MAGDKWSGVSRGVDDPARRSAVIDISSTDHDLSADPPRAIYVGVGGTIVGRLIGDTTDRSFVGMGAGVQPLRFSKITKTGTTATDMLGLW